MRYLTTAFALAALLAATPAPTWADQPNGTYVFNFSGDNDVIDPFADFTECDSFSGATLCVTLDMVGDGKGKYTGTSALEFTGLLEGSLVGPASGSASCVAADPSRPAKDLCKKASFQVDTAGSIEGFESSVDCKIRGSVGPGGFWDGDGNCTIRIDGPDGRVRDRVAGSFTHIAPEGPWTLTVNVAPIDEKKLSVTGSTSLGFQYTAKGKYNPRKDESTLPLKAMKKSAGAGSSIMLKKLITSGAEILEGDASYKVLGNKGKVDLGPK